MKIVIASDSYKGSLDSSQVNEAMRKGILRVFEDAEIICIPIADGGEGTVDAVMTCCGGSYCYETVTGPDGREVIARYGILPDKSAVIEMAAASGLPLVQDVTPDAVMNSTTYGTGQLIASADLPRMTAGSACFRRWVFHFLMQIIARLDLAENIWIRSQESI